MDGINFFLLSFTTLFAIVDPPGIAPLFLAMTEDYTSSERIRVARVASLTAGLVLLFFTFGGTHLFRLLGITHPAFQIAGGIVLLLAALDMIRGQDVSVKTSPADRSAAAEKEDIATTPLAVPMLSGPGAISAVLMLSGRAESFLRITALIAAIVVTTLSAYLTLRFSVGLSRLVGETGLRVMKRLIGLLLVALAVQFVINGVAGVRASGGPAW